MSEASRTVGIIDQDYSLIDERHGMAVLSVASLTPLQRSEMLALLQTCYTNVSPAQFNRDLDEKEWVVLARDLDGAGMRGFSTLRTIRVTVDDQPIVAFYSGDTVARPDTHGSATTFAGTRLVIRKMFYEMSRSQVPQERFVWFTINSTIKGYRLTSMIFREFVPTPGRPLSQADTRLIAELCRIKGLAFDSATGIVRLENPTRPRELFSQGEATRQDDPYVRFFRLVNPAADAGERIASLIELTPENLTPVGERMVFR
jgi:hypothetical protein